MRDLVVGIDSSTQSTKAIAWDAEGTAVAEGRRAIPLSTPQPGWVEQDPADWWTACAGALSDLTAEIGAERIASLAISNQRETVSFFNATRDSIAPAMLWLDERAKEEIAPLAAAIGAERLHRITGKPLDVTPVVYKLAWARKHMPDMLDRSAAILDVHGFLTRELTGTATASWTSADPFGLFDIESKTWSEPILQHLGLEPSQLAAAIRPGSVVGTVTGEAAAQTGLRPGTPVVAGGGDGQCAGLGVNAARPGVVYLNLGTAQITGAWSPIPAISHNWRSMTSPTAEGYFLEGCQRAGTYLVDWFIDRFAGGRDTPGIYVRLETEAASLPIGSGGVTVCPYLSGCMDPHWNPAARASFSGLGSEHGPAHLYRATLEALTLESARCVAAMEENGLGPREILAVGGGAQNDVWVQMMADATGLPVVRSVSAEASALGAGMTAAVAAGWFEDFDSAAQAMSTRGDTVAPDPAHLADWQALSVRQALAYRGTG